MKRISMGTGWRLVSIGLLMSGAAGAQSNYSGTYTALDLGLLPGGTFLSASGINNLGQVVGYGTVANGATHAFLYTGGNLIDLGSLGGTADSVPYAINNSGQVVGQAAWSSGPAGSYTVAFFDINGSMIPLAGTLLPGGCCSLASGINNNGQIVGYTKNESGTGQAFVYGGGMSILPTLGGVGGGASAINDNGQIVGSSALANGKGIAFLYSNGNMSPLGTLGGTQSAATAINNNGQVVGYSFLPNSNYEAFLYSNQTTGMVALGQLPGGYDSWATGINNAGQIVGTGIALGGAAHVFISSVYSNKVLTDLNSVTTNLPAGVYLSGSTGGTTTNVVSINDYGQIAANGSNGHAYLLTPGDAPLTVLNPFQPYAVAQEAPPALTMSQVLDTPLAIGTSLAADGVSAVVLAYKSVLQQPVTLSLSATGQPAAIPLGSLGNFDPNYLAAPVPLGGNGPQTLQVSTPTYGPDAQGYYWFLALLWAPSAMPDPNAFPLVNLAVSATQQGGPTAVASVALKPPPLLLIHGVWSSAAGTGFAPGAGGFYDYIAGLYSHNQIFPVDYGPLSARSFTTPQTQSILLATMSDAIAKAAATGFAARTVDVVVHSMGGLVTRYFLAQKGYQANPALLSNPIHQLITIGTPHLGTMIATTLWANQNQVIDSGSGLISSYCADNPANCTLGFAMGKAGKTVGSGVESLQLGSPEISSLSTTDVFKAIVGSAPSPSSCTEEGLDTLIGAFLPGQTVASIMLNGASDTIVPVFSQTGGNSNPVTVPGIVHASLCGSLNVAETSSPTAWAQVYYWLTGGAGTAPGVPEAAVYPEALKRLTSSTPAAPVLNLTGYTQVAASNVTFGPTTGSILTIDTATNITATSSTKTISEVILLQTVTDPTDTFLLYVTQSPFTISFTPTRLGTATFTAFAVFSDNTYAFTTLNYTFEPSGTPFALTLLNPPSAIMNVGDSRVVQAYALYASGQIDVTSAATYAAASGNANVFGVSSGGTVTANGNGADTLDVSYGGVTATAQIPVGHCTYALNPTNQIAPYTGGTVTIQVATQAGCTWMASGGASWLPVTAASGSGNGAITLTAAANKVNATQAAVVTVAGVPAVVTQPATACSYSLSQTPISAPAVGASGTIGVTTSCPVVASGSQSWVTVTPLGSAVSYTIAPNNSGTMRSATLTVGSVAIAITQAAFSPCDLAQDGNISVADVQLAVNQALGASPAVNDVNGDGAANVVDVQIEVNAVLNLVCKTQ